MARAYLKTWYVELGCLAASFLALRSRAMQSLSARCSLMHLSDAPEFFFSGLAMKRIYAYDVGCVPYLEIA